MISAPFAKYLFAAGIVLLGVFIRRQAKIRQPLMDVRLFSRNVVFAFSNLAALINYSATFALGFLLSIYLQIVRGFDSQAAGLILLSQPVLMAVLSPLAGRLSDRVEPRIVSSWGMALTFLGLFAFVFIGESMAIWEMVGFLVLIGVGFALFSSPNTNAIMGSVEKKSYGVASSTLATMRLLGQAVSMAIATLLVHLYIGDIKLTQASHGVLVKSIGVSFAIFAATCFAGIFASFARGNLKGGNARD